MQESMSMVIYIRIVGTGNTFVHLSTKFCLQICNLLVFEDFFLCYLPKIRYIQLKTFKGEHSAVPVSHFISIRTQYFIHYSAIQGVQQDSDKRKTVVTFLLLELKAGNSSSRKVGLISLSLPFEYLFVTFSC